MNTESVCVCCGCVCEVCVCARVGCAYGCICGVQYVLSWHLTSFESDVGGGKSPAELACREMETSKKTDHSGCYCPISPSLPLSVPAGVNRIK